MNDRRFRRNAGSLNSLKYHLFWGPKYRRKVLVGEVADELRSLLYQKAQELEVAIEALEIMSNHIHLFILSEPAEANERPANQFKGFTSHMLPLKFSELRSHLPNMRSRSYHVGSIGHVSEEIVKRYTEMQKSS
jgi:putative transposase